MSCDEFGLLVEEYRKRFLRICPTAHIQVQDTISDEVLATDSILIAKEIRNITFMCERAWMFALEYKGIYSGERFHAEMHVGTKHGAGFHTRCVIIDKENGETKIARD
jgi:hypothetical protein